MDGKDFEMTFDVFLDGARADMVIEEEDRSDREGVYLNWKNFNKVQRLLVVQYHERSCGNFKIDSMVPPGIS